MTAQQVSTVWNDQILKSVMQCHRKYYSKHFTFELNNIPVCFCLLYLFTELWPHTAFISCDREKKASSDNLEDHTGPCPMLQLQKNKPKNKVWIPTWKKKLKFSGLFSLPLMWYFPLILCILKTTCCPFPPSLMRSLHDAKTLSPSVNLAQIYSASCPSLKVPQIIYFPIFIYNSQTPVELLHTVNWRNQ